MLSMNVSLSAPASVCLCTLKDFLACMSGDVNDVSLNKVFLVIELKKLLDDFPVILLDT